MKVHSIAICRWFGGISQGETKAGETPTILLQTTDVSDLSWLQRGTARQVLTALTRIFAERCNPADRLAVIEEGHVIHVHRNSTGLVAVVITDEEYPTRVAFHLTKKLIDATENKYANGAWGQLGEGQAKVSELNDAIVSYQDPKQVDQITKIQGELDDTMDLMRENLDKIIDRGVKLDELLDRSNDLSSNSKMFYKTARQHNRCCVIS